MEIILANLFQSETEDSGVVAETVAEEETSNPILPTGNELFWGAVCFALLWALMKWVLLPPITRTMERRAAKVRDDLDAADSVATTADTELEEYERSLVSAKAEAVRIIEDARARAEAERREVVGAAEADAASVRAQAAAEITAAKERAKADLRQSVATIAVDAAEAVVQKPVDRTAALTAVERYVNGAGSRN